MVASRREFLVRSAACLAPALALSRMGWGQAAPPRIRLSACDWSLQAYGPGGLVIAKNVGLDGLEISAGDPADTLAIADPALREQYKVQAQATGVIVSSIAMGLLNDAPLASDPRGPAWLEQTIDAAADLGAKVILLAFFGRGDLLEGKELKRDALDAVVQRLKDAAPRAREKGVILGIENYLSAKDNLMVLDRVGHDSVRVYYDVRNSTDKDYDVPAEIRELGGRICQIHFKDGPHYLGEGEVAMEPVAAAMADIGYKGWVVLETSIPSKDRDADFTRNATYARKLLGLA
ncbi:MAG: sugar phosphate isomerase/epimerase [Candidatus Hydrogenedentes bacterium]|nr:sugar phosphate isomerase/epimerase [Candidatus Hydrogenedentota bacterium]